MVRQRRIGVVEFLMRSAAPVDVRRSGTRMPLSDPAKVSSSMTGVMVVGMIPPLLCR
jgi:hypothetical protein